MFHTAWLILELLQHRFVICWKRSSLQPSPVFQVYGKVEMVLHLYSTSVCHIHTWLEVLYHLITPFTRRWYD